MAAIYETAYPRIKPNLTQRELREVFTPNESELQLLNQSTKHSGHLSRLGFMILLKSYQYLGRPINFKDIDHSIKKHISRKLGVRSRVDINKYPKASRARHIKVIREYLDINNDKKARRTLIKTTALNTAATKENLADIINRVIEELLRHHYELPAYQTLTRLARAARTVINNGYYQTIINALSNEQKNLIDSLFDSEDNDQDLSWFKLKQEPKKPSSNNVKDFIGYVQQLKSLRHKMDLDVSFIAPARLEHLRDEAMVSDKANMREMRSSKRYALVVILIYMKSASSIDDLVEIFIIWMRKLDTQSRQKLEEYRLNQAENTDEFVVLLYKMLLAVKNNKTDKAMVKQIEKQIDGNTDEMIRNCKQYLGLTEEKHISWMKKPYANKRSIILNLLDHLTIESSTQEGSIQTALTFIKHHRSSRKEWVDCTKHCHIKPDLSLLSDEWFKAVTGLKKRDNKVTKIHRHYYEMAVLQTLMGDLKCSDAYVENAFIYDDPNKQLMTWEEFETHVDLHCDVTKIPTNPYDFMELQKTLLRKTAKSVDDNYNTNSYLLIHNGKPTLKKLGSKTLPPDLDKLRTMVMNEMPLLSIVDVIIDVEQWLNLSSKFKPMSGNESKIKGYSSRFVATSLSYGCNMGPTQTERCLPGFTRKQVAWVFNHHVTEQRIHKTLTLILDNYSLFELPKNWGSGDSASVDGTFLDMYTQNLLAAHHIRYGRYGGVGYYHVSDQYIGLFCNFISSSVHESIYLLDGIVENDSDVKPTKVHGDSWAQSEVLFGLSFLLGVMVMPRIKQFKNLNYYKASQKDCYQHIEELFSEKPINWDLIVTHYRDMLRVVMSIQRGNVKASTVLRRLCAKSRKNKLYFAFRELGRVRRTIFLLNYIDDPEMRRMIQAATCKSEEFNEFVSWVRFGGGGVISDNMRFSQRKIVKYNHLLANMVIFNTVVHQTKAVNKLREEGVDIPDDVLSGFSPYWRDHLNRFGVFALNMDKTKDSIEYSLRKKKI